MRQAGGRGRRLKVPETIWTGWDSVDVLKMAFKGAEWCPESGSGVMWEAVRCLPESDYRLLEEAYGERVRRADMARQLGVCRRSVATYLQRARVGTIEMAEALRN